MIKQCLNCEEYKEHSKFSRNKYCCDGLNYWCKKCMKQYGRQYYAENRDKLLEYAKQYREKHKDERKQWYKNNKEYIRQYREEHKDKIAEYRKNKYNKNKRDVVYFIRAEKTRLIKIGFSNNFICRFSALQVGSPDVLSVLKIVDGSKELEKAIHFQFEYCCVRGEWFNPVPELIKYIDSLDDIQQYIT